MEHAIHVTGVIEREAEFLFWIHRIHVCKALPRLRLAVLDKADQGVFVQSELRIVLILTLGISACCGQEERLDVTFKAFFCGICYWHNSPSRIVIAS